MSDTVDIGIDLGTTNSAIAVSRGKEVLVIKNNDGWDYTPSAVWISRPDVVHVGRRAYDRLANGGSGDVATEFKLEMGLAGAERRFTRAGLTRTPIELSAAVLGSLRGDAAHLFGTPPTAAVITIPASFALNQNEATAQAAELAGFTAGCPLVQEPTAAAFAYGFADESDRARWMVFDLGGGTFDAAIVSKRAGELQVLHHDGDPYLGGKLIDWAIVERVLAPAVAKDLGLADFRRDNPAWADAFALLKSRAEEAKIALSRSESFDVIVELPAGETNYVLTRGELTRLAEPFYARAVAKCRSALADGDLGPDDLDKILLVGGPTLSPVLRDYLSDPELGLGVPLDFSQDPSTVVARGAALFASTVRLARPVPTPTVGRFALELAYEPSVSLPSTTVAGRLHSAEAVDWTGYRISLHNPDGRPAFHTTPEPLAADGTFAVAVDLDAEATSRFSIELTDGAGHRQELDPDHVSITYRDVEFGGAVLTRSLGIRLADRAFAPMLRKGTTLPTRSRQVFRTSAALFRAEEAAPISIPVVEGESPRGDRNREVGTLQIRPGDVHIDLPAGSDVEVTFEIDASRRVTVVADVPLIQEQFEAEMDLGNVRAPEAEQLDDHLAETEQRMATLRSSAEATGSSPARRLLTDLDEQRVTQNAREQVRVAHVDVGAAAAGDELLRDLDARLDDVEDAVTLPKLTAELQDLLTELDALLTHDGDPADRRELAELRRRYEAVPEQGDPAVVRELLTRATRLAMEIERRRSDWPLRLFFTIRDHWHSELRPRERAAALIREGERAVAAQDMAELSGVNQRLIRLLPQEKQGDPGLLL